MIKKNLVLVGGGGHCKSVIDVAESAGYNILGILDMPENVGKSVFDYKIIGTDADIPLYVGEAEFVITVGFIKTPDVRIKVHGRIKEAGGKLATIVASTAYVSRFATLEEGTIVMHQAFINAGVWVGENCIINTCCNIEHDSVVGAQSHVSTGTMVNGDCRIGKRVFIGSQSVLVNGVSIGDDIIVGAGSLVRKSIREKGMYSGNPAILKIKSK